MILVIGASGTLGGYFTASLDKKNIPYEAPSSKELNICSDESVNNFFKKSKKFDAIYLLAAETNVDLCETDPNKGYVKNFLGTERIAKQAAISDAYLVYISTSSVFGGGLPKWRHCEIDTPNPVNLYGSSKLFGEKAVQKYCQHHLIVRSSWMIGGGPERDKKFLSKIIPQLQQGADINIVHDKFGALTYAKDLADFLVESYQKSYTGVVHFASIDYASRYDIAKYVAKRIGSKSKIRGIDSCCFPLPAPRPISEALYSVVGYIQERAWEDIIDDYLKEWIK